MVSVETADFTCTQQTKIMRVSELYKLNRRQPALDFVDVDIDGDTPLFISPTALESLPSEWGDECVHLVQNYFRHVLQLIRSRKNNEAEALLRVLREPNETHLGLSKDKSRGRALGNESAHDVWKALSESRAATSGLLEDLEDTVLMIDGVSVDIVSDMATNIIREPLIRYTQQMCDWFSIPTEEEVDSGPLWDATQKKWYSKLVKLPVTATGRLLLVPKAIVRQHLDYDASEYFRHYILQHLQEVELNANSSLVQLLKNGRRRVTKKSLMEKYGSGKEVAITHTRQYPEILKRYKKDKKVDRQPALSHDVIAEIEATPVPDWDALLDVVITLPTGTKDAHAYETSVEALLTALLYPSLTYPIPQHEIHDGRKRIDITYTNIAKSGFFNWVGMHYPASHIYTECKNYKKDLANPELDQLSGRFSPSRGKVGLIVCRSFENKQKFLESCRDTARDDRGWIVPLDDEDLKVLVLSKKKDPLFERLKLIEDRFRFLLT